MTTEKNPRGRPKSFASDDSKIVIQSLDRAIDLMNTLAEGGAMTLSEVAARMAQSPATLYRILTTLQRRALVEADAKSQEWSIGPDAFRLGAAFLRRSSMVDRARPVMRHLMEMTGETSNLGIEKSDRVMFVCQVETEETIRAFFPLGTLSPLHASGIGKVMLSRASAARLDRLFKDGDLESFTRQTIVTRQAIGAELARIRQQGFAFDNEEKAEGMRCIAAPIVNFHGEAIAGISISGPSHRLTMAKVEAIGSLVRAAAEEVSRSLGAAAGS
ncbi:MAG: IclR family transcriptional regulator [Pseudorhodobacter sp.]|nr:IclR family transcriptional regulator [Pseudorhodobacter sp.]